MHCDWPADFYEDCASPASEILFQFFENANDTPPPDDPTIIAAGTLLLESSHDPGHLPNVVNDEDFLLNQIINVVNHTFFSYDEASSHTEDSLSPVGSSPSLSLELDISDVESEPDEEALEEEQTDGSSADDYFGEDVVSSSQEMSENADSHGEESISIEPNSFYEQDESPQEILSSEDSVEKSVSYIGETSDDSSSSSGGHTSTDDEILLLSILDESASNENISNETENVKSSTSSDEQSSSVTLPKPSTSKCDSENAFDEIGVKSHDNVPSCSEKEKSNNETSCDISHEQENNESNSELQSNLAKDNSVLESDDNSYHEDSVVSSSRNSNVSEVAAGSSSGPDRSASKLKHKISSDPEDGVPSKVPKYISEAVSASNDNLRDQ